MSIVKRICRRLLLTTQYWWLWTWFKLTEPPRILIYHSEINKRLLSAFGAQIGKTNVRIFGPVTLNWKEPTFHNLTIEDDCVLNGHNFIDLYERITLEKGVNLGPGVVIMTHNSYDTNSFLNESLAHTIGKKPVHIKAGASIKAKSLIVHGVTVGESAVVAGGAVVNRDVEPYHFVVGIPAKTKRILKSQSEQRKVESNEEVESTSFLYSPNRL
ncbi:acyltransferase [Leptolyngbya sp. 7M]|uniref:acyltransferase n=1 Tax=Leptolyngbya sp. 7M TaxID=2812896 RepID=UPI001B8B6A10|nr:acyltransferase [Leptolyngbya sp. 7M]QYO68121.1 acyltransferase [Leptolyngbya sp. 7M]